VGFCRPISQSKNDARITQAQILALNSAVGPRLFHCNSKQFHIFCATPPPSLKLRLWFVCPLPLALIPTFPLQSFAAWVRVRLRHRTHGSSEQYANPLRVCRLFAPAPLPAITCRICSWRLKIT